MIQNGPFGRRMVCDRCGESEVDGANFQECRREAADLGWRFERLKEQLWEHVCPDCLEQESENMFKEV